MNHPNSSLKIAMVGCGAIAQAFHLPLLKQQKQVEVAWLIDTNPANLKKVSKIFPLARQAVDMKAIEGVDAVIIATPPGLHFEHAQFALLHGWHALVEKPLATRIEDARKMVDLAREKKY